MMTMRVTITPGTLARLGSFADHQLARGTGPRHLRDGAPPVKMSLAECETYDNGVASMNLRCRP
jgi:hypothetical protein